MIQPTEDYIIIKPDDMAEKTESGIILPESRESDVPQTGIVFSGVGYKKGMKVWVKMWAGDKIKYKKEELLIVHKKDIVAYEG